MLKVALQKWGQTSDDLRDQALEASHPRTRERFLALYEVSQGKSSTQVGQATQRNPQTVMSWVHQYNQKGPEEIAYRHTGGRSPLYLSPSSKPLHNKSIKR